MSESVHDASWSSCHKMSSSVLSSLLVIKHFLNALMMIDGSIDSHAILTHYVMICSGGRFMLPVVVCSAVPDIIHVDHSYFFDCSFFNHSLVTLIVCGC